MPLFFAGVQSQDVAQRGWLVTKLQDIAYLTGWETASTIASGCETAWVRSGQTGRGPPYTRTIGALAMDDGRGARYQPDLPPTNDQRDRRFVKVSSGSRVHWAIGLLGVEEDLANLAI